MWVIRENASYNSDTVNDTVNDTTVAEPTNNNTNTNSEPETEPETEPTIPTIPTNHPTLSETIECTGDIPNERSDFSMVGYRNRYILLFGGKNHEGEYCFNDLYILDLNTKVWKYVGEMGEDIELRCGHSFGLLCSQYTLETIPTPTTATPTATPTPTPAAIECYHLVVYGGSNPEDGTCSNNTYYAALPASNEEVGKYK